MLKSPLVALYVFEFVGPYVLWTRHAGDLHEVAITQVAEAPVSISMYSGVAFDPKLTSAKYEKSVPSWSRAALFVCVGVTAVAIGYVFDLLTTELSRDANFLVRRARYRPIRT